MTTSCAPPPNTPAARVERVTKRYGDGEGAVVALDDVTLEIGSHQLTAIMGPSGSGKSTLMHVMAGLDNPTSGRARIGDVEITSLGDDDLTAIRRRQVGFVFQAFNLVPTMDILANVLLPFELDDHTPDADQSAWVDTLVERLALRDRLRHRPGQLSGGQQQRVAIARALATRPDLVLADEPTGNLDSRSGGEVLALLADAAENLGQSIVMVTHDASAAAHASRVVFIADGRLVHDIPCRATRTEISRIMDQLQVKVA